MAITIRDIGQLVLRVIRLDEMIRLYCEVLGCRIELRQDEIGLVQLRAGAAPGRQGRNLDHFCFRVEPFDQAAIRTHLAAHGVPAGPAEQRYGAEGAPRSTCRIRNTIRSNAKVPPRRNHEPRSRLPACAATCSRQGAPRQR